MPSSNAASTRQTILQGATSAVWGRRVVGIDLHRLREDIDLLPSSTQYVLTTHWHLSEVQQLLKHQVKAIQEVRVQLSQTFYEDVRRLHGLMTGLILRDPESVSGYRKLVRELAEVRGKRTSGSNGRTGGPDADGHR